MWSVRHGDQSGLDQSDLETKEKNKGKNKGKNNGKKQWKKTKEKTKEKTKDNFFNFDGLVPYFSKILS